MIIGLSKIYDHAVRLGKAAITWGVCDVCGEKYGDLNGTWMPLCAHMDALYQCMKRAATHSPRPICSPEVTEAIKIGTKFIIKKAFFVETPVSIENNTQDRAMIIVRKTADHINSVYIKGDIIVWFATTKMTGFALWRNGVVIAMSLTSEQCNMLTSYYAPNVSYNSFNIKGLHV